MYDDDNNVGAGTIAAYIIGAIVVILLVWGIVKLITVAVHHQEQHDAWLKGHCKVIATTSETSSYAYVNGHYGYINTPGSTTYKCDDGTTRTEQN